jgi:putative polyketide hydroxylase
MASADPIRQLPVVIVGAGPAGLVTAVTLARNGIASLLVERNPGLSPLPRATAVSTRTMELLRSWGLEDEVRAGQLDITAVGAWTAETMASPDGVLMPLGHPDLEQAAAASPTRLAGVPQDHWEPVLLRHLETFGLAEVRFGTELVALDQDADGVLGEARVLNPLSTDSAPVTLKDIKAEPKLTNMMTPSTATASSPAV